MPIVDSQLGTRVLYNSLAISICDMALILIITVASCEPQCIPISNQMSDGYYDGFHRAQDPREYLDAPAMLIPGFFPNEYSGTGDSGAALVTESIKACDSFQILAPEDLHGFEVELTVLRTRIADIVNRIDVETKMREAATSLSKLHTGPASPKSTRRLSRIFHSNDSSTTDKRRLSRQAEDEITLSRDRIRHLEESRQELVDRQREIERRVLEHHSAVLSHAVQGRPAGPTHKRGMSGSTVASSYHPYASPPKPTASESHASLAAELNSLVQRLQGALPQFSPASSPVAYIQNVLRHLLQTCDERAGEVDAYRTQANSAEERIQFLSQQLSSRERTSTESAKMDAEHQNLRNQLNSERQRSLDLRQRFNTQRKELEQVVTSLENVTKAAVQYETERRQFVSVTTQLESNTAKLDEKIAELESGKLGSTRNTSNLCNEFRLIVRELHEKHYAEMRDLRKRTMPSLDSPLTTVRGSEVTKGQKSSQVDTPSSPRKPIEQYGEVPQGNSPTRHFDSGNNRPVLALPSRSHLSNALDDENVDATEAQVSPHGSSEMDSLWNQDSHDASSLYPSERGASSSAFDLRDTNTSGYANDSHSTPQKGGSAEDATYDDSGSVMTTPQLNSRPVAAADDDNFL